MVTPNDKTPETKSEPNLTKALDSIAKLDPEKHVTNIVVKQPAPGALESATFGIEHIKVLHFENGADRVCLQTKLTEATYPWKQKLILEFPAAKDTGLEYCEKNFPGVPVEVVDAR